MDQSGQLEFSTVTTESEISFWLSAQSQNLMRMKLDFDYKIISAQLSAFGLSAISEPDQIITLNFA